MKGDSQRRFWPSDTACPQTQYEALFHTSMLFDGLRDAFLVTRSGTEPYEAVLTEIMELLHHYFESQSPLTEEQLQRILRMRDALVDFKNNFAITECAVPPPDFINRAWPVYLRCIQKPRYYFSVKELSIISAMAKVNVVIFSEHVHELSLVGQTFNGLVPDAAVIKF